MFSHSNLVESQRNKIDSLELDKRHLENKIKSLEGMIDAQDRDKESLKHKHKLEIEEIKHLTKISKEKQRCEHQNAIVDMEHYHLEKENELRANMHDKLIDEIRQSHEYMAGILKTLMQNMHGNSGKK